MKRLERLIPPPLVMLLVGLLMWGFAKWVPELSFAWLHQVAVAGALALLGVIISLASVLSFKRAGTTIHPQRTADPTVLVSSGPYRYTRNPMYVGVLLMLLGWGVYLGNLLSIFSVAIFIAYITRFQIVPEERLLQENFGQAFLNYKNKVRRWF